MLKGFFLSCLEIKPAQRRVSIIFTKFSVLHAKVFLPIKDTKFDHKQVKNALAARHQQNSFTKPVMT